MASNWNLIILSKILINIKNKEWKEVKKYIEKYISILGMNIYIYIFNWQIQQDVNHWWNSSIYFKFNTLWINICEWIS